jgi:hypothetical protein
MVDYRLSDQRPASSISKKSNSNPPDEAINRFRVIIRTRPLLQSEESDKKGRIPCIKRGSNEYNLILAKPDSEQRNFTFDSVLDQSES